MEAVKPTMDPEISTAAEFNKKYSAYIEDGNPGLDIEHYRVIIFLDVLFKTFIELPNFKFKKITIKNRDCLFESNLHNPFLKTLVEDEIKRIIKSR